MNRLNTLSFNLEMAEYLVLSSGISQLYSVVFPGSACYFALSFLTMFPTEKNIRNFKFFPNKIFEINGGGRSEFLRQVTEE